MSKKDFIKSKLDLIKKDNQDGFKDLAEPLAQMAENGEISKTVEIPADGNWFTISFDAVQVKENRLVISAKRVKDGLVPSRYDPSTMEYVVEFQGTRAAYLYGYYKPRHPILGRPFISWDIRSYANNPANPSIRVYVSSFRAHNELRRLILAMERVYGTSNIVNKYINDNKLRFQLGIKANKSPEQIEKEWSQGLMESLGYHHVEAADTGYPKGTWKEIDVHWCKNAQDLKVTT